jgi:hypothetical protein
MVVLPVEYISKESYEANNRKFQLANFRRVATLRERYWTDKLCSLWPRGFNSIVPGRPQDMRNASLAEIRDHLDVAEAKKLLEIAEKSMKDVKIQLNTMQKTQMIGILQGLISLYPPKKQTKISRLLETIIRQQLRVKQDKTQRPDFIKFLYSNNLVKKLNLNDVLRLPEVYQLHPEPAKAAAISVVYRLTPQLQTFLFNYSVEADDVDKIDMEITGNCN